jgi:CheY-like chemotaxis protein/anti-sigma regulatory factor (Ser/Thr protein kinase)
MTAPHGQPPRILVVEDDDSLRHVLTHSLTRDQFEVSTAGDGVEALEKLRTEPFDLVLLDIRLPRLGGLDVLKALRARDVHPRVIVMTADGTPETLLSAVKDQVYEYLGKPFSTEVLLDVVRRALAAPAESLEIEVVSAKPEWVELIVPCSLDVAGRVHGFIRHLEADLPESIRESMGQAFRELLHNAIEWGGKLDPSRKVRISCLRARRMLLYRIADPGEGFKIDELRHAAVSNPADAPFEHALARERKGLRPGGFGIVLVREMVDELLYNEKRNEVVFVKYLDDPAAPPVK